MKIIGIDPAPAKNSIVFDGKNFLVFTPRELKEYINQLSSTHEPVFISWDAPLSAAIDINNFSLTIRKIERFFNRLGRYAKDFKIPEGISTIGYSGCPHWTLSQYIFSLPILNPSMQEASEFKLVMCEEDINSKGFYITEIHPTLSMWILLKDILNTNLLFENSWKYKGDKKEATLKKRSHLIQELLKLPLVKNEIDVENVHITSDDELDAFVCWLMATINKKR